MAIKAFTGNKLYIDGYDRSGDYNKINLNYEAAELEATTIGDTSKAFIAGLKSAKFDGEVFSQSGAGLVETTSSANFAVGDKLITVYPVTTAGGTGHAFKSLELNYSPVMKIGDISRLTITANMSGGVLVKVTNMESDAIKTSTGTGTARLIGAASATQTLYSFLHVTAISGTGTPTITVVIASDDAAGFTTPTTKITHTAFTAIGAELKTLAGPITDTYYRVAWTISGTNPSFTFNVGLGII